MLFSPVYRRLVAPVCMVILALAGVSFSSAQESIAEVKGGEVAQVKFAGQTFTRGYVGRGENSLVNEYFLPQQGPRKWTHILGLYIYPGAENAGKLVANMSAGLKKQGVEFEVIPMKDPKVAAIAFSPTSKKVVEYNLFYFYPTPNGKALVGRQFVTRGSLVQKDALMARVEKYKRGWFQQLQRVSFPQFKMPPAEAKTAGGLPELKFVQEKVDDILHTGKLFVIDEGFVRKQGGKGAPTAPFSLVVPKVKNIYITGKPKVQETVRVTFATDDKNHRESIRLTPMRLPLGDPMDVRVQKSVALIEAQLVPKFFKGYAEARIVGRYKTKIGPYDAGVIVSRVQTEKGQVFFVKFVTILQPDLVDGLVAVLMLDPAQYPAEGLKEHLANGFSMKVLHTVRFLK